MIGFRTNTFTTNDQLCSRFAKLMQSRYEMSFLGELNYFLGLQVSQINDGIFICQSKYVRDLLKRYGLENASTTKTLMTTATKLDQDDPRKSVDITRYDCIIASSSIDSLGDAYYDLKDVVSAREEGGATNNDDIMDLYGAVPEFFEDVEYICKA